MNNDGYRAQYSAALAAHARGEIRVSDAWLHPETGFDAFMRDVAAANKNASAPTAADAKRAKRRNRGPLPPGCQF